MGLDGTLPVPVTGIPRVPNSPNSSINSSPATTRSRPWHDFGRQNDADKVQIPKMWVILLFIVLWGKSVILYLTFGEIISLETTVKQKRDITILNF